MNTKEFFEALEKDADLQKKFEGVNSPEKFFEIAKVNGLTDDLETMKTETTAMLKEYAKNNEVDMNQLSEISGGDTTGINVASIAVASATAVVVGLGPIALAAAS